jgi:hypothetical protein
MTMFTYSFVCADCPYGAEVLFSAIEHVTNTGHVVNEYVHGAYHPAITTRSDGPTTRRTTYTPPRP